MFFPYFSTYSLLISIVINILITLTFIWINLPRQWQIRTIPETKSRETLRLERNKTHYFPREYTLSALLYSKERKINNTYTIIVFHDIMTINRRINQENLALEGSFKVNKEEEQTIPWICK